MTDSVAHQLQLLLNAYGYNLYNAKNRARADDLLVRQAAAGAVGEAASAVRDLRTEYRRQFIPPPTRDQPDSPPERLADLRARAALQERLSDVETRIRSTPVPTQDRVWERFRREQTLLNELLLQDYQLIAPCHELREQTRALTPAGWTAASVEPLERLLGQIEQASRTRAEFLHPLG
jgi:hypothetical protein